MVTYGSHLKSRPTVMKKFIYSLFLACASSCMLAYAGDDAPVRYLRVANWSMYIDFDDTMDPDLPVVQRSPTLREFAEKYNCVIEYHEFDSFQAMLAKFIQLDGFYDIMVTSCGYTGNIMPLDVIMPFDASLIPNLQTLDEEARHPPTDPDGRYLIPYLNDYVGLAFRKDKIGQDTLTWGEYFDPPITWKGHVGMLEIAPVIFATAIISAGKDYPHATTADFIEAQQRISSLPYNFNPLITDDPAVLADKLLEGEIWATPLYAPDAQALLARADENIAFVIPEDGSEFYYDYFIINRTSKNKETAHLFINHILEPDVLGRISAYLGAGAPSSAARAVRNSLDPPLVPSAVDENGHLLERLQITFSVSPEIESRWLDILLNRPHDESLLPEQMN